MISDAKKLEAARKWLKGHSYCGLHGLFRGDAMIDNCPSCHLARVAAERDGLREAIQTHRSNVWGDGEVRHDADVALYGALEGKP